jgi:short-subunit dehydrogenase
MKRIIIYGASSGIGKALACMYAEQGDKVAVAARRIDNLKEMQRQFPNNLIPFQVDVTDNSREQFNQMVEALQGADLVVYCSGMGKQNVEFDMDIEYRTIDVNVTGFTSVVAAVVEYGSKAGHHVQFATISSIASTKGLGVSASYSATKMYQVRYLESMRQLASIKGWDMGFTVIKPGFIATDFIKDRKYPMTMTLDYAAKRIKRAIDKRKNSAVIDWKWAIVVGFWKMIPNWLWYKLKISRG